MAMVRYLSRVLALSLLCAASLGAQGSTGTITGRVIDSASRQPLAAVSLRIVGTQRGAMTREDGSFTLPVVPTGAQRVRAPRTYVVSREVAVRGLSRNGRFATVGTPNPSFQRTAFGSR